MITSGRSIRFACLLAGLLAATQTAPAVEPVKATRDAVSGEKTRLAHERSWNRTSCAGRAVAVAITQQPAHGTLSIVDDVSTIPASVPRMGSTGVCAGRSVNGKQIVYQSAPGFHGSDRVVWRTTYDGRQEGGADVTILVK